MEGQPITLGATHYQVLNLTPALLDDHSNPSTLIKRAYHRALLQNHPDKKAAAEAAAAAAHSFSSTPSSAPPSSTNFYSVDQITNAYTILSSPRDRAAYDTSLRLATNTITTQDGNAAAVASTHFRTGVENVDLDDLPFDEAKDLWYRSCRCGNDRGYVFGENDLDEVGDVGELMVGCLDCSLWLNVHFAQVENDDDDEP